jgi:hypothetical protein
MECCGEPFGVGSTVEWNVVNPGDRAWFSAVLGDETADELDAVESHHGLDDRDALGTIHAVVRSIEAVFCTYGPQSNRDALYPVKGTGVRVQLRSAPRDRGGPTGLDFVGYLVEVDVTGVTAPTP